MGVGKGSFSFAFSSMESGMLDEYEDCMLMALLDD